MEHFRHRRRSHQSAFTLIEMLVVLAIIVIITTVVLTSQSTFNKTVILANTAYDIALTLRSVETYGLSSRGLGGETNVGYGFHVEGTPARSFTLFADSSPTSSCDTPDCKPGDHIYTAGQDVLQQVYTLGNNMTISKICVDGTCNLNALDVVFSRPNPDAFITANSYAALTYTRACLTITTPQGGERYLSISKAGQIIANALSCP